MTRRFIGFSLLAAAIVAPGFSLQAQTWASAQPEARRAGFGAAVAIAGDEILVGESRNAITPGAVWVFTRAGAGAWAQTGRILADDAEAADGFGAAIAVEAGTMLVGSGQAAYVFERGADGWVQQALLSVPGLVATDGFGAQVALAGDWAFVAAPGQNNRRGAIHTFRRSGSEWSVAGTLESTVTRAGAGLGAAMSVRGDWLVAGAPMHDGGTGAVFTFQRTDQGWSEAGVITADAGERNDRFGSALTLYEGGRLLVGAARAEGARGTVIAYGFSADDGQWSEIARLSAFDGSPQAAFGGALAVTPGAIWVGAPFLNSVGRAYLFERNEAGMIASSRHITVDGLEQGDLFGSSIAATDGLAVIGLGNSDGGAGSVAIFENGPEGWMVTGEYWVDEEALDPIVAGEVACEDDAASAFGCDDVDLVSFLPIKAIGGQRGTRLNDVWGWTDAETGKEYALVGRTDGTSFVDVSNATTPVYLGDLPLTQGSSPSSWRDIKVYQDHAYIVADNAQNHGMQVFDLTRLRSIDEPETFEADALYDRIASAHNIVINEESGFAYSVGSSSGGETCGGGLHMIDIRDPKNPTFAGCFQDMATGRAGTGYSHDAQCVMYRGPDEDYADREICLGSNETALSLADVTDKANPIAISNASYPNVAYAHQGWLTEDHRFFYMNDEGDEAAGSAPMTRTLVWDLTDLDDPQLVKEHMGSTPSIDHNLYVRDNMMYQSNYVAGLRVFDVSDPANPIEVGHFDTYPWGDDAPRFQGSWSNYPYFESGNIVVTGIGEGLFLVKSKSRPVF